VEAYALDRVTTAFEASRARFEAVLAWLAGPEPAAVTHAELEDHLQVESREVFRQLLQDHLDLRAQREPKLAGVVDADQVTHHTVEAGRARTLATVFGDVRVERLAYRARRQADLHPADAALNLMGGNYFGPGHATCAYSWISPPSGGGRDRHDARGGTPGDPATAGWRR
jgi:hypothetical protein